MKHGSKKPLIASVILHLGLVALLATNIEPPKSPPKEVAPMSSYIYTPPKKVQAEVVEKSTEDVVEQKAQQPENIIEPTLVEAIVKSEASVKVPEVDSTPQTPAEPLTPAQPPEVEIVNEVASDIQVNSGQVLTSEHGKTRISGNILNQLDKLRSSIDKQIAKDEFNQMTRHRSLSGMHPNPAPAPTSIVPLTPDQEKAKNTINYGGDIAITKGKDGNCFIEEDLGKVGIDGVKAVSRFNCGESDFNKSFRLHMEKVRKKIGK